MVFWVTEEMWSEYHSISAGLVSQTAMISGRARMSVRCIQRAAAEANSRPINPQPMMPKVILRIG